MVTKRQKKNNKKRLHKTRKNVQHSGGGWWGDKKKRLADAGLAKKVIDKDGAEIPLHKFNDFVSYSYNLYNELLESFPDVPDVLNVLFLWDNIDLLVLLYCHIILKVLGYNADPYPKPKIICQNAKYLTLNVDNLDVDNLDVDNYLNNLRNIFYNKLNIKDNLLASFIRSKIMTLYKRGNVPISLAVDPKTKKDILLFSSKLQNPDPDVTDFYNQTNEVINQLENAQRNKYSVEIEKALTEIINYIKFPPEEESSSPNPTPPSSPKLTPSSPELTPSSPELTPTSLPELTPPSSPKRTSTEPIELTTFNSEPTQEEKTGLQGSYDKLEQSIKDEDYSGMFIEFQKICRNFTNEDEIYEDEIYITVFFIIKNKYSFFIEDVYSPIVPRQLLSKHVNNLLKLLPNYPNKPVEDICNNNNYIKSFVDLMNKIISDAKLFSLKSDDGNITQVSACYNLLLYFACKNLSWDVETVADILKKIEEIEYIDKVKNIIIKISLLKMISYQMIGQNENIRLVPLLFRDDEILSEFIDGEIESLENLDCHIETGIKGINKDFLKVPQINGGGVTHISLKRFTKSAKMLDYSYLLGLIINKNNANVGDQIALYIKFKYSILFKIFNCDLYWYNSLKNIKNADDFSLLCEYLRDYNTTFENAIKTGNDDPPNESNLKNIFNLLIEKNSLLDDNGENIEEQLKNTFGSWTKVETTSSEEL